STGERMAFDILLSPGRWLEIDTKNHKITLDGTSQRQNLLQGDWITFPPGGTEIYLYTPSTNPDGSVVVTWRDSWQSTILHMAVRTTWNNAVEGQPDYDEQDLRNLLNAFLSTGDATSSNKVVGGILRTGQGEDLRVSTNGTYNFTVKPGRAAVPATARGQGAFTVYNDTETSFPIEEVADATYSRLDSVYIRAFSPALGDAETGGEIGIVYGNFASVPTAPAIPDNSIRLAVIEVPPAGNPV